MKKNILLTVIANIVLLFPVSCTKESEGNLEGLKIEKPITLVEQKLDPKKTELSEADALLLAGMINKDQVKTRSAQSVEKIEAIVDEENTPLMYIINYDNNEGFLVLSATKTYYPIIAMSEKGHLEKDELEDSGAEILIGENVENIKISKTLPPDSLCAIRGLWCQYEEQRQSSERMPKTRSLTPEIASAIDDAIDEWTNAGYTFFPLSDIDEHSEIPLSIQQQFIAEAEAEINPNIAGDYLDFSYVIVTQNVNSTQYGPLLTSQWDQFRPYKNSCWVDGVLCSPGCTAIAVAQIMRYHEWPTNYDWDDMPDVLLNSDLDYVGQETTLSEFLYDVAVGVDTNFGQTDSGSDIYKARTYLLSESYSTSSVQDHNLSSVIADLAQGRPVLQKGRKSLFSLTDGHEWVCDGYWSYSNYTSYDLMVIPDDPIEFTGIDTYTNGSSLTIFHMNMGNSHNGWYNESSGTSSYPSVQYQYYRKDLYNIHPN